MPKGYLSIVLHAHLPYVRHPEHARFLEEEWYYEAVIETYVPLVRMMQRLLNDGVDFNLTMSLTPTLLSMMTDPLLQSRTAKHLERLIELADREMWRTRDDPRFFPLAEMYFNLFLDTRRLLLDRYHGDLSRAFRELGESGKLEIITCGATHGFFPLMEVQPEAVRAQVRMAARTHERILGKRPKGIWLPECGFAPGVDRILREEGIRFFMVDSHAIWFGSPRPKYGVFAPVYAPSGVAAFGRDVESSKSVWSAEEGYPGDYNYREFYRDIGFDLDHDYIRPYLNGDGSRTQTGIKYYRITGSSDKSPYDFRAAREKAAEHAGNFVFNRAKQIEHLAGMLDRAPMIISPYDAELYGHWWFEGPQWLEFLFRKIHHDQDVFKTLTPMQYLEKFPRNQVVTPSWSSWGYKGYAEVWLNGSNDWIYRHLHQAVDRMAGAAKSRPHAQGNERRVLNQMARELLLAQSSDWAFIMKTGTHVSYAQNRTKDHLSRFNCLWEDLNKNSIDTGRLESIELVDNLFPDADYKDYLS